MNQTITIDKDEWQRSREQRHANANPHADNVSMIHLPLPAQLEFKAYALAPVILDDNDNTLACKTKALKDDDSLMNYDFSDCYILDYFMNIGDAPTLDKDTWKPDFDKPWQFTSGRMIRYAGEIVEK